MLKKVLNYLKNILKIYGGDIIRKVVIGLGGAGVNVISCLIENNMINTDYYIFDTHYGQLVGSKVTDRSKWIQLGDKLLSGAGGIVELGEKATLENIDEIKNIIVNYDLVIITVGLSHGTGTGGLPVIIKLANELGIKIISLCSMLLEYEGPKMYERASNCIEKISKYNVLSIVLEATVEWSPKSINALKDLTNMNMIKALCINEIISIDVLKENNIKKAIDNVVSKQDYFVKLNVDFIGDF